MATLTEKQAFAAMVLLLRLYYDQTKSGDVALVLFDLGLLPDGSTADPAAWEDWVACVDQVMAAAKSPSSWEEFEQKYLNLNLTYDKDKGPQA